MANERPITARQLEFSKIWKGAASGDHRDQIRIYEELAFGDLPSQLIPLIRRTLVGNYTQVPKVWDKFTDKNLVQSIDRDEEIMTLNFLNQAGIPLENGGNPFTAGGLPTIGIEGKYPKIAPQGSSRFARTSIFGESFGAQWKELINTRGQSVRTFDEAIVAFGNHAAGQEDIVAQKLLMVGGGINPNLLAVSATNELPNKNPLKSILDLQAAVRQAQTFQLDGTPVYFTDFALVVPNTQVSYATQILSSKSIMSVGPTSVRSPAYEQTIDLGANITVVGARFLASAALGGASAIGSWFLVPTGAGRPKPTLLTNFLEGYETPSFFLKNSNAVSIQGGSDTPIMDGDFDTDSIDSKVRHVLGATMAWSEGLVFSDGTGTAAS